MEQYTFGVEIEAILEPHKIRSLHRKESMVLYFDKLKQALSKRGLEAKADDLSERYRKRPEHYNKWWITKDGSLKNIPDNHGKNRLNIHET